MWIRDLGAGPGGSTAAAVDVQAKKTPARDSRAGALGPGAGLPTPGSSQDLAGAAYATTCQPEGGAYDVVLAAPTDHASTSR